jgi:hypothetical protein
VLNSGTSTIHGDVYEYNRNSYFNAGNPFTSIDALGHIVPRNQLRYNDFGGPVVLPHIYDGKDKTFFFFSWETSLSRFPPPPCGRAKILTWFSTVCRVLRARRVRDPK